MCHTFGRALALAAVLAASGGAAVHSPRSSAAPAADPVGRDEGRCSPQDLPPAFVRRIRQKASTHPDPEVAAALLALADRGGLADVVCAWEDTGEIMEKVNRVADAHMRQEHQGVRWKRGRTFQRSGEPEYHWFVLYSDTGGAFDGVEVRVDTRTWEASDV